MMMAAAAAVFSFDSLVHALLARLLHYRSARLASQKWWRQQLLQQ
jgi:hypothetical protein